MIWGVSFDTVAENRAFADKFSFPYLLLCDESREIGIAYGAADNAEAGFAKRISYVIDPEGKIGHVFAEVDVKAHAGDVLAAIG